MRDQPVFDHLALVSIAAIVLGLVLISMCGQ
jgi:hypothetical protein